MEQYERRFAVRLEWHQWAILSRLARQRQVTPSEAVGQLIERAGAEANGLQARPRNEERPPV